MLYRFSTCIGLEVVADSTEDVIGQLSDILINPDSGEIEGFFLDSFFVSAADLPFLSSLDILRWGTQLHVRDAETVYPAYDRVRLVPLLESPRTVMGQLIRTEDGQRLGRCKDIQFNTESMRIEWLFPRQYWRWQRPVPVTDIVEVKAEVIIVKEQEARIRQRAEPEEPSKAFEGVPTVKPHSRR